MADHPGDAFDDIVVGAGSSGAPLAARLSEDRARKVAVIEAGPDYATAAETRPDLLNGNAMSFVNHDWNHTARLFDGRQTRFYLGKVTGGSSAVGNLVAIRGMPEDYDEWAAGGNPEWSWSRALPFLRAIEDDLDFEGEFHGRGGPVPISRWRPDELTPLQTAYFEACLAASYPLAEDHNHPQSTGVGPIPSNCRPDRVRVSTAMSHLGPARVRDNLTILSGSLVSRVVVDGDSVRGVELVTGANSQFLQARRVILAAGTVGSPAILLRSGIGPAEELRELGIGVRADLPGVGKNLTDQPRSGVFMVPKPGNENLGIATGQIVLLTAAPGSDQRNDMYYAMVNGFDLSNQLPHLRDAAGGGRVFGVMVIARRAYSRGQVTLTSPDPRVAPRIDLNYLADERDYQILADGVRVCWELAHSPGIRSRGDRVVKVNEDTIGSPDALRHYVRLSVDTAYNPVGTARMGPREEHGTVVDQYCAVHGIDGLYVADASVMPLMVRANINLTVIMIGEMVAAMLRGT